MNTLGKIIFATAITEVSEIPFKRLLARIYGLNRKKK